MSRGSRVAFVILFVLVAISLALNIYLITRLQQAQSQIHDMVVQFGPTVETAIGERIAELEALKTSSFKMDIEVEEEIPLAVEFPFEENFAVPIELTVPISQTIDTVVTIPIAGFEVPVPIEVPINLEIPIEQEIDVPIATTIDISTTVPIVVDVPIEIDIGETELIPYINALQDELVRVRQAIIDVLADIEANTDGSLY